MFAGQLLFLVPPLPPFLPIFLRKHSHFRSTPYLPYHGQFVSLADWRRLRSALRAEPLMLPEFSIPPIWSRIRSLYRSRTAFNINIYAFGGDEVRREGITSEEAHCRGEAPWKG
jgi:hypothetical protein